MIDTYKRYSITHIEITDHKEASAAHSDEWALPIIIESGQEMTSAHLFARWRENPVLESRPNQEFAHDPAAIIQAIEACEAGFDGRYLQQRLDKVPFDNTLKTTPGLDKLAVTMFIRDNYFDGVYGVSETHEGSEIHHNGDVMSGATLVVVPYLEDEELESHRARVRDVVRALTWALNNPA